jgi:cytochrome c oxidase subunit 1
VTSLAVSALFIGSIYTPWAVVWGSIPVGIGLVFWFWPAHPTGGTGEEPA